INRLLNKYGDPIDVTLAYRQEIGRKIETLERTTDDLATLQRQLNPLRRELKQLGEELSSKRLATAKRLSPLIEKQLTELGVGKEKGKVQVAADRRAAGCRSTARHAQRFRSGRIHRANEPRPTGPAAAEDRQRRRTVAHHAGAQGHTGRQRSGERAGVRRDR